MREPEDEEWEDKPGYGDDSVPTQHWMEEPRYKQLFNEIEAVSYTHLRAHET